MSVCPADFDNRDFKSAPEPYNVVGNDEKRMLTLLFWNTPTSFEETHTKPKHIGTGSHLEKVWKPTVILTKNTQKSIFKLLSKTCFNGFSNNVWK